MKGAEVPFLPSWTPWLSLQGIAPCAPLVLNALCHPAAAAARNMAASCLLYPTETVTSAPSLPHIIHEPIKCTCSMQGTGFSCPSGVGGHPPQMKVVTGDILADITGRNVSEYLLYTSDRFRLHRQERGWGSHPAPWRGSGALGGTDRSQECS